MSGHRWNNRFNPPLQTAAPLFPRRAVETPQTPANHTTHQMLGAPPPSIYTNQITQIPDLSLSVLSSNVTELTVVLSVSFNYAMQASDHFNFTFTPSNDPNTQTVKSMKQTGDGRYTIGEFDPGTYYFVYVTPVINGNNTTSSSPPQQFLSSPEVPPGAFQTVRMNGSDGYAVVTIPTISPAEPVPNYISVDDNFGNQQVLVPVTQTGAPYKVTFGPYTPQTRYVFTLQAVVASARGIYRYGGDYTNSTLTYVGGANTTTFIPGPPPPPYYTGLSISNTTVTTGVSLQSGIYPVPDYYKITTYAASENPLGSAQGAVQIPKGFSVPTANILPFLPAIQASSNLVADLTDADGNWYSFHVLSSNINTGGGVSTFTNPYYTATSLGSTLVAGFTSVIPAGSSTISATYLTSSIPSFTVASTGYSTLKLETFANNEYTFQADYLSLYTGPPSGLVLSVIPGSGQITLSTAPITVGKPRPTAYKFTAVPVSGGAIATYNSSLGTYTIAGLTNGKNYSFTAYAIANGVAGPTSTTTGIPSVQPPLSLAMTSIVDQILNFNIERPLGGTLYGYQVFAYGTGGYTVSAAVADQTSVLIPGSITLSAAHNPYTLSAASVNTSAGDLAAFVSAPSKYYVGPPPAPVVTGSYIGNSPYVYGNTYSTITTTTNVSLTLTAVSTGVTIQQYNLEDLSGNTYPSFGGTCTISQPPYISRTYSIIPLGNGLVGTSAQITFNFNPQTPSNPIIFFDSVHGIRLNVQWSAPVLSGNDFYILSNVNTYDPKWITTYASPYVNNNVQPGGYYQYRIYANICGVLTSSYAQTGTEIQGEPGDPIYSYTFLPTGIQFTISENAGNYRPVDQFVVNEYYSDLLILEKTYTCNVPRSAQPSLLLTVSGVVTLSKSMVLSPYGSAADRWSQSTSAPTPDFTVFLNTPTSDTLLLNTYNNIVTLTISQGVLSYTFPVTSFTNIDSGNNKLRYANPLVTISETFDPAQPATFIWTSGYGPFIGGTYSYTISANRNGTNGQGAVYNPNTVSTGPIYFYVGSPENPRFTTNNVTNTLTFDTPPTLSAKNAANYTYIVTDNYGNVSSGPTNVFTFTNLTNGSAYSYSVVASWCGLTSIPSLTSATHIVGRPTAPVLTPLYYGTVATISTTITGVVPVTDMCLKVTGGTYTSTTANVSASYLPGTSGPTFIVNVVAGSNYTFTVSAYANQVYSTTTVSAYESFTSLTPRNPIWGQPTGTYDLVSFNDTTAYVTICTAVANQTQRVLPDAYYANINSIKLPTNDPVASWQDVASSSDGTKLAAVTIGGGIYTSSNSGITWNKRSVAWETMSELQVSIASSSNGSILVTAINNKGIYISSNYGDSWTLTNSPFTSWTKIVCSSDGTKLAAVAIGDGIYTSSDSGNNWMLVSDTTIPASASQITSSSDGTKLAVTAPYKGIYTGSNSGITWKKTTAGRNGWSAISSSSNGSTLVAASDGGIFISSDYGDSWTKTNAIDYGTWTSVASSADGTRLFACDNTSGVGAGGIWTNSDSGNTWYLLPAPQVGWKSVACSSDGKKVVGVSYTGTIYYQLGLETISQSAVAGQQTYTFTFPGLTTHRNYQFFGYTATRGLSDAHDNNGSVGGYWSDKNTYDAGGPYPIQGIAFSNVTPTTPTVTLSLTVNLGAGSITNNPATYIASAAYFLTICGSTGNTVVPLTMLTSSNYSTTVSSGDTYTANVYAVRNLSQGSIFSASFGVPPAPPLTPTLTITPNLNPDIGIVNGTPIPAAMQWSISPTLGVSYQWSTDGKNYTLLSGTIPYVSTTVAYGASYNAYVYSQINGISSSVAVSLVPAYAYTNMPTGLTYTRASTTINLNWGRAWQPGFDHTVTYNISYYASTPTNGYGMSTDTQHVRIGIHSISDIYSNTLKNEPGVALNITLSGLDTDYLVKDLSITNIIGGGATYYTFDFPSGVSLTTPSSSCSNMAVIITNIPALPSGGYTVRNLCGGVIASNIYSNNYTFTGVVGSKYNVAVQALNNSMYSVATSATTGYFSLSTTPVQNFMVTYFGTTISMTWTISTQLDGVVGGSKYIQTLYEQTAGQLTNPGINSTDTTYPLYTGTLGSTYNFYIVDSYYALTANASANQISLFTTPASNVAQSSYGTTLTVNWSSAMQTVYNSGPGTTNPSIVFPNGGYILTDLCGNYSGNITVSSSSAVTTSFSVNRQYMYNFAVKAVHNGVQSARAVSAAGPLYVGADAVTNLTASLCGLVATLSWTLPAHLPQNYTIIDTGNNMIGDQTTTAVRSITCNTPGTYVFTTLKSETITLTAVGAGGGASAVSAGGAGGLVSNSLSVPANTTIICTVGSGGSMNTGGGGGGGGNSTIYVPGFQILDAGGGGGGGLGTGYNGSNGMGFNNDGGAGGVGAATGSPGSGSGPAGTTIIQGGAGAGSFGAGANGFVKLTLTTETFIYFISTTTTTTTTVSFAVDIGKNYNFVVSSLNAGLTCNSSNVPVTTITPVVQSLTTTFSGILLSNIWTNVAAETYLLTNLVTGSYFILPSSDYTGSGTVGGYYNFSVYSILSGIPSQTATTSTAVQIYSPPPKNFAVTNSNTTLIITASGTVQVGPPTYATETFSLSGSDTAGNKYTGSGILNNLNLLSYNGGFTSVPGRTVNLSSWGVYNNLCSAVVSASCVLTVPSTTLKNAVAFSGNLASTTFNATVAQGTPSADQIVFTPSSMITTLNTCNVGTPYVTFTAMSDDGGVIVSTIFIANTSNVYVSTNFGVNWTSTTLVERPTQVAVSSNGTVGVIATWAKMYVNTTLKTNPVNWTSPGTPNHTDMYFVCISPDGSKIVTAQIASSNLWYADTSAPNTFTSASSLNKSWKGLAWSRDGTTVFASARGDYIYISTDNGHTWATTGIGPSNWNDQIATNYNGLTILTGTDNLDNTGNAYLAKLQSGSWTVTKTVSGIVGGWRAAAMSSDGKTMMAGQQSNICGTKGLYISYDGGNNWQVESRLGSGANGGQWISAALSSNGLVESAAGFGSNLLVLSNTYSSVTPTTLAGSTTATSITGTVNAGTVYSVTPLLRYLPGSTQTVWTNPLPPAFVPVGTGGQGSVGFGAPVASGWFLYSGNIFAGIFIQTTVSVAQGFAANLANYYNIAYSGPSIARATLIPYWVQNGCAYWQLQNTSQQTLGYDLIPGTYTVSSSYIYNGITSISSGIQFNVPPAPVTGLTFSYSDATTVNVTFPAPKADPTVAYTYQLYINNAISGTPFSSTSTTVPVPVGSSKTVGIQVIANSRTSSITSNNVSNTQSNTDYTSVATTTFTLPSSNVYITTLQVQGAGGYGGNGAYLGSGGAGGGGGAYVNLNNYTSTALSVAGVTIVVGPGGTYQNRVGSNSSIVIGSLLSAACGGGGGGGDDGGGGGAGGTRSVFGSWSFGGSDGVKGDGNNGNDGGGGGFSGGHGNGKYPGNPGGGGRYNGNNGGSGTYGNGGGGGAAAGGFNSAGIGGNGGDGYLVFNYNYLTVT